MRTSRPGPAVATAAPPALNRTSPTTPHFSPNRSGEGNYLPTLRVGLRSNGGFCNNYNRKGERTISTSTSETALNSRETSRGERVGADLFPPVSRLVVKVGTSTLTNAQGRIDRAFIADLAAQLARQKAQNRDVVLVTSGAIRAGREALNVRQTPDTLHSLPYKQAAAAIGQGLLMHTYTEAFAWRDVTVAQVLLTRDDLSDQHRLENAQNTLAALLDLGVVPIINENDTVAVEEIKFGDNDTLAALVATLISADLLLILSDVEGLYASPPGEDNPNQPIISVVPRIDASIEALAGDTATPSTSPLALRPRVFVGSPGPGFDSSSIICDKLLSSLSNRSSIYINLLLASMCLPPTSRSLGCRATCPDTPGRRTRFAPSSWRCCRAPPA